MAEKYKPPFGGFLSYAAHFSPIRCMHAHFSPSGAAKFLAEKRNMTVEGKPVSIIGGLYLKAQKTRVSKESFIRKHNSLLQVHFHAEKGKVY